MERSTAVTATTPLAGTALPSDPAAALTVEEFEAQFAGREESWELVEGVPVMPPPPEAFRNSTAAVTVAARLLAHVGPDHHVGAQVGVRLPAHHPGGRDSLRVPDVAVVRRGVAPGRAHVEPTDVALAVEITSPSSVEHDWITKRREYGRAGIPAYLVVDARTAPPRLWLFENPGPDGYPDPAGDGTTATLTLGEATITLTSADLDDFH